MATVQELIAQKEALDRQIDEAQRQAKADAMKNFNDTTIQLEAYKSLIAVLPAMVEAAAKPIAGIGDVKVVHFTGGSGGKDGGGSPVSKEDWLAYRTQEAAWTMLQFIGAEAGKIPVKFHF